jgi:hypothetical protein
MLDDFERTELAWAQLRTLLVDVVETRLDTTQGAAGDDDDEVTGGLKHKPNQQNSYAESSP